MDLRAFETPEVTPMLVKLYDKHKTYAQAKDGKSLARAELTAAVSGLLDIEMPSSDKEMVADVLIGLMRQAEIDLRQALSERLAVIEETPLRLVLEMANDDISVASPILRKSEVLGDMDLIYIIKSKTAAYWQAIAKRQEMSNEVMDTLADTRDLKTALVLAENEGIELTSHTLGVLSDIAQSSDRLAKPLVRRPEITPELAKALYQYVGEELKGFIFEKHQVDSEKVDNAIDDIVEELSDGAEGKIPEPNQDMFDIAADYKAKGILTESLMIKTLQRGQFSLFVALFTEFSGLDARQILEVLKQKNGQSMAVVCRAKNVLRSDFASLFLLTGEFRNGSKKADTKMMDKAMKYFDKIKPDLAKDLMKSSLLKH